MADNVLFSKVVENEFLKGHESFFKESDTLKQAYFLRGLLQWSNWTVNLLKS